MLSRLITLSVVLSLAVFVAPLAAQEALSGSIVSVKGPLVQVRGGDADAWQMAKAGMPVSAGTEFRTGPRSAVVFRIEPGQIITLDRTGTMKVMQAVRLADGKIKTDVAMPYGVNNYKIERAGLEHEATVHTPAATLAVRGSEMQTWHDFDSGSMSKEHSATFTPTGKTPVKLPEDMQVDEKSPDAGSVSKEKDTVDPQSNERSDSERGLIVNRPNGQFQSERNDPRNRHHVEEGNHYHP